MNLPIYDRCRLQQLLTVNYDPYDAHDCAGCKKCFTGHKCHLTGRVDQCCPVADPSFPKQ